jgi:hypothetical protein
MFRLTDEAITGAVGNISGFIVATVADESNRPLEEITEAFFSSETYSLLSDKDTGYYWDSILEVIDLFKNELHKAKKT